MPPISSQPSHQAPPRQVIRSALSAFVLLAGLGGGLGCQPKPLPPKLPPKEVPHLSALTDTDGERGSVIGDAVAAGSNQARIAYDCGPAFGKNVEGSGTVSRTISRCEMDTTARTVVLASEDQEDCPGFLLTLVNYHGPGTYNTASLGPIGFGIAKVRQTACNWEGNLCLDWNGAQGPHGNTSCTIEINSDGGLQYGTSGAVISGTFVCSAFISPFTGCAGNNKAVAGCGVTRASFSAAGCSATTVVPDAQPPGKKPRGKKPRADR